MRGGGAACAGTSACGAAARRPRGGDALLLAQKQVATTMRCGECYGVARRERRPSGAWRAVHSLVDLERKVGLEGLVVQKVKYLPMSGHGGSGPLVADRFRPHR